MTNPTRDRLHEAASIICDPTKHGRYGFGHELEEWQQLGYMVTTQLSFGRDFAHSMWWLLWPCNCPMPNLKRSPTNED